MAARSEIFGETPSGEAVERVFLTGGGLTANVLTWGAVVQDLRLDGHDAPLVLGFEKFEYYSAHSPYFGAVAGRFANRIANGRFLIGGETYQLDTNFLGKHALHGGREGTGKRNWTVADLGTSHVILALDDPDGAMGFPGHCRHTCSYTLKENATLQVALTATVDTPTIVNLAPHSYFTLNDARDCRDHILRIDADRYLPVDEELIPTGEVAEVTGTGFEFRQPRFLSAENDGIYDHNFCLSGGRRAVREVARLRHADAGLAMTVSTTEPGLQIYTGSKLDVPVPGLRGRQYSAFSGIAIEPQLWPDAPNHEVFPSPLLVPGEESRQVSEFRFESEWS